MSVGEIVGWDESWKSCYLLRCKLHDFLGLQGALIQTNVGDASHYHCHCGLVALVALPF
jgi:hypothetical protein